MNFTRTIFPFEERTYKLTSIVLRNKSLFIPGGGKGGKVFGLWSDHMGGGLGFWRDHMRGVGVQKIPFRGGVIRYYVLHSLRGGGSGKLYHNTNKIPPSPLPPGST